MNIKWTHSGEIMYGRQTAHKLDLWSTERISIKFGKKVYSNICIGTLNFISCPT
jgi:hypothetical protein